MLFVGWIDRSINNYKFAWGMSIFIIYYSAANLTVKNFIDI